MSFKTILLSSFCIFAFGLNIIHAETKQKIDTIHVKPHDKTLMLTDPSRGVNEVMKWGVFPSEGVSYRKVIAYITLQCPNGMRCGAWDYLDYVILRRKGGEKGKDMKAEIVRLLTPYGGYFDNKWQFTWQQDVTDWGYMLRDSIEIEYRHTGYESNENIGWLVTVDFEIITGKPVMECMGMDSLWLTETSFAYGNEEKPFETLVKPKILTMPEGARMLNWRIIQTGHGMDKPGNCSEFCNKWRDLYFDGEKINRRQMYIVCGTNPVYPQAGTWLYSRANWCPGSLSIPDVYTLPITKSQHTFELRMEPYLSTLPQGGWAINAYVFYYKSPTSKNDVTLEEIMAPSQFDAYQRFNPICAQPKIKIKNSGVNTLTNLQIEYGLAGQKKLRYQWKGNLKFMESEEITLPGIFDNVKQTTTFEVVLQKPNGKKDEYEADNVMYSQIEPTPVYGKNIIVKFMTNKDSTETSWTLYSSTGEVVYQHLADSLKPNALYQDTLCLTDGCYQLQVIDTSNNGLSFWANPEGGYGYFRLFNSENQLLKTFNPDFGTSIIHSFRVRNNPPPPEQKTVFTFTNTRVVSTTSADIVVTKPQTIKLRFIDNKGNLQTEMSIHNFNSQIFNMDLSHLPTDLYKVELELEDGEIITKSIRKM